jgi:spermidine synthase
VKIWTTLDRAETPEKTELSLKHSGHDYLILANGRTLMSSDNHGSEEALSTLGCARILKREAPTVLVGGLGMGFTLRAALDVLPPDATVVVAELLEAVVTWNKGPLGPLAGNPLADPRSVVAQGDIAALLRDSDGRFDAILLDVDNGPVAFSQEGNSWLYGDEGIAVTRRALKPDGTLAVWSAWGDKKFEHRLTYGGFGLEVHVVRARLGKGGRKHTIFLGHVGEAPTRPKKQGRPKGRKRRR